MRKITLAVMSLAATLSYAVPQIGLAQNLQGWQSEQQNAINQAQAGGGISQNQASRLDSQEAAIRTQEQQYLNQNGGHLTNAERAQVGNEMNQVNGRLQGDEHRDANGQNGRYHGGHHGQWRNNGMLGQQTQQNYNGAYGQPGYQPTNFAGFHPNANGYVPNAFGYPSANPNAYGPNPNGYGPNPNGYGPNPNGYAQNNGNVQQRGGMLNTLEHLIGGQNNGGHTF